MRIRTIVIILVAASNVASAQIPSGSLIIFNFTKNKLVMAADSRAVYGDGRKPDNTQCKIRAFKNKFLFAIAGAGGYEQISPSDPFKAWKNADLFNQLTTEVNTLKPTVADFESVIGAWGNAVTSHYTELRKSYPQLIKEAMDHGGGIMVNAFFAAAINGKIEWRMVFIMDTPSGMQAFERTPDQLPVDDLCWQCGQISANKLCALGLPDDTQSICTRIDKKEMHWTKKMDEFQISRALVEHAGACSLGGEIGGEVDMVQLSNDGTIAWLDRKQNCAESEK